MAKKSGSKSSRNERRAGRKRAEQARAHGLPERRELPARARASTPEPGSHGDGEDRSSDAPPAPAAKSAGIPTLVKVLGGALVILVGVYLLSRKRDEALTETKPSPEVAIASAAPELLPQPSSEPAPDGSAAPAPAASPVAPTAVVSVTHPTKPVVVAPVVAPVVPQPAQPRVEKPVVAAPKPAAPVPAAAEPKPAAPKPADNPY